MKPVRSRREKTLASLSLTAVILCLGLVVSALSAYTLARRVQADAQADFWRKSDLLTTEISQRLSASVYGLRGARGAFVASERVDRAEFKALVESMDLQRTLPGNRGFGWIDWPNRSYWRYACCRRQQHANPVQQCRIYRRRIYVHN